MTANEINISNILEKIHNMEAILKIVKLVVNIRMGKIKVENFPIDPNIPCTRGLFFPYEDLDSL